VTEEGLQRLELAWGIEDFLVWPTSLTQVVSRLKLILWRLDRVELQNGIKVGALAIDFEKYEVYVNGQPQELTYKEFELLKFLATHPGKVLTREVLLNKVWGYDYYGGTRTVDVHIRRLRSKLETGRRIYIETVRNVGYKFVEPG
jgi:DNA-binding response OmpR family regulator